MIDNKRLRSIKRLNYLERSSQLESPFIRISLGKAKINMPIKRNLVSVLAISISRLFEAVKPLYRGRDPAHRFDHIDRILEVC